ncbi:MAG: hypothetical protein AVDCRST_MAG19-2610, partial [uncultured Thermomicrobiales bacterium]
EQGDRRPRSGRSHRGGEGAGARSGGRSPRRHRAPGRRLAGHPVSPDRLAGRIGRRRPRR